MSKKLLIIVCAFLLAGCQLAKPEMDSVDTDRLIGYYLDFKPYEKMTLKESFNIDSQDYETSQSLDFSHLDGYLFIVTRPLTVDNFHFTGRRYTSDELYWDIHEFSNSSQHSATLSIDSNFEGNVFYYSSVYQDPYGTITIDASDVGFGFDKSITDGQMGGFILRHEFIDETTHNKNFELFNFWIRNKAPLSEASIIEFNEKNEVVETTSIDESTQSLHLQPETDYLLFNQEDENGQNIRQFYTKEEGSISIKLPILQDNHVYTNKTIDLIWK